MYSIICFLLSGDWQHGSLLTRRCESRWSKRASSEKRLLLRCIRLEHVTFLSWRLYIPSIYCTSSYSVCGNCIWPYVWAQYFARLFCTLEITCYIILLYSRCSTVWNTCLVLLCGLEIVLCSIEFLMLYCGANYN